MILGDPAAEVPADVIALLSQVADIAATALHADCVLVRAFDAVEGDAGFRSGNGRGQVRSLTLASVLAELARQGTSDGLEDITPDDGRTKGRIYASSPAFLEEHNLGSALFVSVACGRGILTAFAGRSERWAEFVMTDAELFLSIVNSLTLLAEREHTGIGRLRDMPPPLHTKQRPEEEPGGLSLAEQIYTCLVETALAGLYLQREGRIVFCNRRFSEMFGCTKDEIIGHDAMLLFRQADSATDVGMNDSPLHGNRVSGEEVVKGITRDGNEIWLQRNLAQLDCPGESIVLGSVIDITGQKHTENALRQSRFELQVLSEKLLQAQESERKRIAMDLHDSVGGSISAIKVGMEHALLEYGNRLPQSVDRYFHAAIRQLCDAIDEVRVISMNLRPPMLDDLGLAVTIDWVIRRFRLACPEVAVKKRFEVEETRLSDTLKVAIFRVIQESLNNIARHAQASKVDIELLNTGNGITLSVEDDGKGFLPDAALSDQGCGLSGMRGRVQLTSGRLAIESRPGAGTLVRAEWSTAS